MCRVSCSFPSQNLHMVRIDHKNIKKMELMNSLLFPVNYKDSFSHQILFRQNTFGFIFYDGSCPVGLCTYQLNHLCVYIMTFGILEGYRRKKYGSKCMSMMERHIVDSVGSVTIKLHVHESNYVGMRFYMYIGYYQVGIDHLYYSEMIPKTAYILEKDLKYI